MAITVSNTPILTLFTYLVAFTHSVSAATVPSAQTLQLPGNHTGALTDASGDLASSLEYFATLISNLITKTL